jgi:hypothetical protein
VPQCVDGGGPCRIRPTQKLPHGWRRAHSSAAAGGRRCGP